MASQCGLDGRSRRQPPISQSRSRGPRCPELCAMTRTIDVSPTRPTSSVSATQGDAGVEVTGTTLAALGAGRPRGKGPLAGNWLIGEHRQGAAFGVRGIIEGFYGPPWENEARLDMIDFAARHRFNTFLYCPQGRPLPAHGTGEPRSTGQEPATSRRGDRSTAVAGDIDPMIGVSPGLSMRYSEPQRHRPAGGEGRSPRSIWARPASPSCSTTSPTVSSTPRTSSRSPTSQRLMPRPQTGSST